MKKIIILSGINTAVIASAHKRQPQLGEYESGNVKRYTYPETNRHPEEIVEYVHKTITENTHAVLVKTMDPDCVSALKYIGEKKGFETEVWFVDAASIEFFGANIDPVFKSFNRAIDLINEYSK